MNRQLNEGTLLECDDEDGGGDDDDKCVLFSWAQHAVLARWRAVLIICCSVAAWCGVWCAMWCLDNNAHHIFGNFFGCCCCRFWSLQPSPFCRCYCCCHHHWNTSFVGARFVMDNKLCAYIWMCFPFCARSLALLLRITYNVLSRGLGDDEDDDEDGNVINEYGWYIYQTI